MQTSRRQFFGILSAALAGATLDPERLLWRPGAKTIFLPPAPRQLITATTITVGDVFTIEGVYAINPRTYQRLDHLQQFVAAEDLRSGDFRGANIYPRVMTEGPYQNIAGLPVGNLKAQPLFIGRTVGRA